MGKRASITVATLRKELVALGLRPKGRKANLIRQLSNHLRATGQSTRADWLMSLLDDEAAPKPQPNIQLVKGEGVGGESDATPLNTKLATASTLAAETVEGLVEQSSNIVVATITNDEEYQSLLTHVAHVLKPAISQIRKELFDPIIESWKAQKREAEKGRRLTVDKADLAVRALEERVDAALLEINRWEAYTEQLQLKEAEEVAQRAKDEYERLQLSEAQKHFDAGEVDKGQAILNKLYPSPSPTRVEDSTTAVNMPPLIPVISTIQPFAGTTRRTYHTYKQTGTLGPDMPTIQGFLQALLDADCYGTEAVQVIQDIQRYLSTLNYVSSDYLQLNDRLVQEVVNMEKENAPDIVGGIQYFCEKRRM